MKKRAIQSLYIIILLLTPLYVKSELDSLKYAIVVEDDFTKRNELIDQYISRIEEYNLDSALNQSRELYEICDKINCKEGMIKASFRIGRFHKSKSEYDEALVWYHNSLNQSKSINDSTHILSAYRSLFSCHRKLMNNDSLDYYLRKAVSLGEAMNNQYELGAIFNELANYKLDKFESDSAIIYYFKAQKLFNSMGEVPAEAITLGNIGNVFLSQNDHINAKKYTLIALEMNKEIESLLELSNNYNNLGIIYKELDQLDSAMFCYEESVKLNNRQKDMGSNAIAYNNMGNLATIMGDYQTAVSYFNKSQNICDSLGIEVGALYNFAGLGQMYFAQKDYYNAIIYLTKSNELAIEYGLTELMLTNYFNLYEAHKFSGNFQKSLSIYEEYHKINDSLLNATQLETTEKYRQLYETEQTKNEALENRIRYEEVSKEAELTKQKTRRILFLLIVSALVLAFIIVFYIRLQMDHRKIKYQSIIIQRNNNQLRKNSEKIKKQASELKQQNDQLNELTEFRKNIINTMVHDLKSPLNSVIGLSALRPNEENQKHIHHAGINMLNLVSNILDVQRQEEAGLQTSMEALNLPEVVELSKREVSLELELKEQILECKLEKPIVFADKKLLRRIFVNLLSNAIKYSPRNSKIQINSFVDEKSKASIIQVIDKGAGIDAEHIDMLFERYNNFNPKDIGMSYSTGIGLSFCKIAVEAMGGEIHIISESGKGTNVWFSLPEGI